MRKLALNFCHSQTCDPVKVKVRWAVQPMGLAVSGCSPSLIVILALGHGVKSNEYVKAPPAIHQHLRALPLVGGLSCSLNLNGRNASRWVQGWPGPPASSHQLVMACAITCWPSCRLNTLALSWACLPTQLRVPDRMNVALHISPMLSPSPRDHLP